MTQTAHFTFRGATVRITPSFPGPLAGYAARGDALSEGTHDELEASLLWLQDAAGGSVAWLTIDAIAVSAQLHASLAATVSDALREDVLLLTCASHTHSGPQGWSGSIHPGQSGEQSPDAVAELLRVIRQLAAGLHSRKPEPVSLSMRQRVVAGVGTNRISPGGSHDATVGVLTVSRLDDAAVLAVLLDYATHPTVLPATNLQWSADWPGAARSRLRDAVGRHAVIGFLQGAAGDVSTRFTRGAQDFAEAARIGSVLADAVAAALAEPGEKVHGPIRTLAGMATLPVRAVPKLARAEQEEADSEVALAAVPGDPGDPVVRLAQTRLDGARVQRALAAAALPATLDLPIEVVAIGTHAWVHCPVELFASLGAELQRRSPFACTRVIGYTNGYFGYLADRATYAGGGYEVLSSLFAPAAADLLIETVGDLLERIHTDTSQEAS
jgi:neutral ceramidase